MSYGGYPQQYQQQAQAQAQAQARYAQQQAQAQAAAQQQSGSGVPNTTTSSSIPASKPLTSIGGGPSINPNLSNTPNPAQRGPSGYGRTTTTTNAPTTAISSTSFGSYNPAAMTGNPAAISAYPGLNLMQQNAYLQAQRQQMAMGITNPSFNNMAMSNIHNNNNNKEIILIIVMGMEEEEGEEEG
eukprot:CAMPEP_0201566428 /NCGR_PEP_ID=MMETSP0190_2-20130828/6174_1 /ASSEMBLY_ACC=CAM_ASM_000263 /TAXON_ID=37353 /ORGANISM="Rosalina sp." /LENGTH=184 /DNA_ID=CAMNT_0047985103 /DNA_START=101 /DNA_END=652 /DNA_ORIENTATION=+